MVQCGRMKRPQFTLENWIYSWLWKSSKTRQQFYRWESFATNTGILTSGSTVKNHISLKTVFGYSATRRTPFRSWFLVYLQLLQAPLPQHPRLFQVRQLIIQITIQQSSQDRQARGDPFTSETSYQPKSQNQIKMRITNRYRETRIQTYQNVARIQRESCGWKSSGAQRLTRKIFSWTIFRTCEKCGLGWAQCLYSLSRKAEIARSARGPKLQEPRAEDALAESHPVQKIWWLDNSRSQSSQ